MVSYKVHQTVSVPPEDWYRVEGTHAPLVSPEDFQRVQALGEGVRCAPGGEGPHLFAGLLRCADCGKAMTRRRARGTVYYHCSTYRRKSKAACTKHTIREDVLCRETAAALGVPELSRPLLFAQLEGILIHEGGGVELLRH